MLFPQKGVRFIAVNDNVDSVSEGMDNDFTPLRNLFNEWLVRDTSKKIKAVKKSKGMSGKPVTSKPVYGYLMDEDENFIIDEEAAPVVQQIYQLCLAGNRPTYPTQWPSADRNGKIFYTSIASLSHISKVRCRIISLTLQNPVKMINYRKSCSGTAPRERQNRYNWRPQYREPSAQCPFALIFFLPKAR